jgi:hypothetical protein
MSLLRKNNNEWTRRQKKRKRIQTMTMSGNNVEKKEDYIIFKIDREKELFSRIRTYFLIEHIEQRKDGQI